MFDVLTYQKGGALLRMLEQYLGEERFRDGIRHYLAKHSYGNTETSDLWDALEAATGEPVRRIMDTWIWQGGYPLVTVRPTDDGQRLVLDPAPLPVRRRRRRQPVGHPGDRAPAARRRHQGGPPSSSTATRRRWRPSTRRAVVVVNAGSHGFYRVAYEGELLERLTGPALAELSTPERYSLVDDAWSAVVAGALEADAFVRLAGGLRRRARPARLADPAQRPPLVRAVRRR